MEKPSMARFLKGRDDPGDTWWYLPGEFIHLNISAALPLLPDCRELMLNWTALTSAGPEDSGMEWNTLQHVKG